MTRAATRPVSKGVVLPLFFLGLAALHAVPGRCALPSAVEGQPLPSLAPMLESATPAVVNISTRSYARFEQSPLLRDPFFRRFFDLPRRPSKRRSQSLGSGVIVDAGQGYVLTNHHVVAEADEIAVTLRDGRVLAARLVGSDPAADVAVVQIPAEQLAALPVADSDQLRVGDFVLAIGNPFGLGQTVTSGIVSALGRSGLGLGLGLGLEGYEDFIQTDASINPGNSGGALVNLRGELVGVNTAILAPSGGNVGIGFAIPANMAMAIMRQLVAFGKVKRGEIGVRARDLTPQLAAAFGLAGRRGAVLGRVFPGSAAARAGLSPGDVVIALNRRPVRDADDLRNAVGVVPVGSEVALELMRQGKRKQVTVVVEEPRLGKLEGQRVHPRLAGVWFDALDPGHPLHQRVDGAAVSHVESPEAAARTGLREGDVVVALNRRRLRDVDDMERAARGDSTLLAEVPRGAERFLLVFE